MIAVVVLGLLALSGTGEGAITAWVTPLDSTAVIVDGGIEYKAEGTTGTIYTFEATTGTGYAILSQTTTDFFEIATPADGVMTLKGTNVLDGAATTLSHVVVVKATDAGTDSGTATLTINILPAQFAFVFSCVYITPGASGGPVVTNALSSVGTNVLAFLSGNTNTDFDVTAAGVVTTAKAITTSSGSSGAYTLVITGKDGVGTVSTATTTLSVCVRDTTCVCALPTGSGAAHITAGLLGIFAAVIMILLK